MTIQNRSATSLTDVQVIVVDTSSRTHDMAKVVAPGARAEIVLPHGFGETTVEVVARSAAGVLRANCGYLEDRAYEVVVVVPPHGLPSCRISTSLW